MSPSRLVVVGASLAGLRAVEAARHAGFEGSVTLVGAEPHLPYDRPPLSKDMLDPANDPTVPTFRSETTLRDDLDVDLRLGRPATGLDVRDRIVEIGADRLAYDALVIATGSTPRTLPGAQELEGVHGLRTVEDAMAVRAALDDGARVVVVGAGFIGSEVASAAWARGLDATIVEAAPTPLRRAVGPVMGPAVAALHSRHGTPVLCGRAVACLEGSARVERVVLDDGTRLPADLVVVGIGVDPAVSWLHGSGLRLDDGVVCDENLWTGVPGVYAAGDVASWDNPVMAERQRMENWTAAAEQGAAAVRNAIASADARPYGTVPYFWSDWYDGRIQLVGSPEADEVVAVDGDPDGDDRWVALYRRGGRLIGALTVNRPTEIMKYRVLIARGAAWQDALEHAERRRVRAEQKARAAAVV